jgi:hypothetical protein
MTHVVRTLVTEISDANILEVEAGGIRGGGDAGHGGRTYLRIKDLASTAWDARLTRDAYGTLQEIEIVLGGDAELDTFVQALRFAARSIEGRFNDQVEDVGLLDARVQRFRMSPHD